MLFFIIAWTRFTPRFAMSTFTPLDYMPNIFTPINLFNHDEFIRYFFYSCNTDSAYMSVLNVSKMNLFGIYIDYIVFPHNVYIKSIFKHISKLVFQQHSLVNCSINLAIFELKKCYLMLVFDMI